VGAALDVEFTTNEICVKKSTHMQVVFKGLTLLVAKTFWETTKILSEYRDGHEAVLAYFGGGSKVSLFIKHLKNTAHMVRTTNNRVSTAHDPCCYLLPCHSVL